MSKKSKKTIKNVKNINIAKCFKGDINDFEEFAAFFTKKYSRVINENYENKKNIKNDKKASTSTAQNLHLNKRPSVWDFYFDNHNSRDKSVHLKTLQNEKENEVVSFDLVNDIYYEDKEKNLQNFDFNKNHYDMKNKDKYLKYNNAGQNKLYDVLIKTKENVRNSGVGDDELSCNFIEKKKSSLEYLVELSYLDYIKYQNDSKKLVLKLIEKEKVSKNCSCILSFKNNTIDNNSNEDTFYDQLYEQENISKDL